MSIMAKTPSGYKKIGSVYLGEQSVDKVYNANGDVIYALQRELTGVPPLLFKGKEQSELRNYRIYGDTVDGNNVGDLVESGQHAGEYVVPVTVEGKNLLQNTATSQTINGVTFTVNSDGSITCNGTSTSQYYSLFRIPCYLVAGNYTISGCPVGGGAGKYRADIRISPNGGMVGGDADIGAGVTIPIDESGRYDYTIRIQGGYTVDDVTFKPMIRRADIEDDTYEPYHAPVTTPIYLPEPIKMVGDEAEYIDYAEQKQHRVRKNLLQNTATNQTINGVTFTVNEDGSVTCNGTASSTVFFAIAEPVNLSKNIVSGCPRNGSSNSYLLRYQQSGGSYVEDKGNGVLIPDYGDSRVIIRINAGYTCKNLTFYPMIRKADITDGTYEPYIENTDLDATLPSLPTIKGTNTMSVDTEVQPSRMDIEGRIKSLT